ncbi:hypothetical protein HK100_008012, partial [Physocladia obscura]
QQGQGQGRRQHVQPPPVQPPTEARDGVAADEFVLRIDRCVTPAAFIPECVVCIVCTDIVDPNRATVFGECSHVFCDACLAAWSSKLAAASTASTAVRPAAAFVKRCPTCNANRAVASPLKSGNAAVFRIANNLQLTCRNRDLGCSWTGAIADDDAHFKACNPAILPCPKPACARLAAAIANDRSKVQALEHQVTELTASIRKLKAAKNSSESLLKEANRRIAGLEYENGTIQLQLIAETNLVQTLKKHIYEVTTFDSGTMQVD